MNMNMYLSTHEEVYRNSQGKPVATWLPKFKYLLVLDPNGRPVFLNKDELKEFINWLIQKQDEV